MPETSAPAGVATAAAAVLTPRSDLDINTEAAAAAGVGANASSQMTVNTEAGTATTALGTQSVTMTTVAEAGAAEAEIDDAIGALGVPAQTGEAEGSATDSSVHVQAIPSLIEARGSIIDPVGLVAPHPQTPAASGASHGASMRARANPQPAAAIGSADDDPMAADGASARVARATSVGHKASYHAEATTGAASASGSAINPSRNAQAVLRLATAEGTAAGIDPGLGAQGGLASGSATVTNPSVTAFPVKPAPANVGQGAGEAFGLRAITSFQSGVATAVASSFNASVVVSNDLIEVVEADEIISARLTQTFQTTAQPHCLLWHPDYEGWATEQVQARHNGVLWRIGEYSIFVLLWRIEDFENGLVARCPECITSMGDVADVYNQSTLTRCPTCYGTTFEGGFKARIVRPALWDFSETTNRVEAHGEVERANAAVQSTNDFAMRTGDYIIRADGTRWRVQSLSTNHLHTGFGFPGRSETVVGFNYGTVILQDEASNAYSVQLPADPSFLDVRNPRSTQDFTRFEEVRGPILAGHTNTLATSPMAIAAGVSPSGGTFDGGDI